MAGKEAFLRDFFGSAVREIGQQTNLQKKDPIGLVVISPFLGGKFYFLQGKIGWGHGQEFKKNDLVPVEVPPGFVTDLASIPRLLWPLLPRDGDYMQPAIVHDYLYWIQDAARWPRSKADQMFRVGMQELKVSKIKCALIYYAVMWFGGGAWKSNTRLRAANEKRVLRLMPDKPVTWTEWKQKPGVFMDY
jgi:hypothetical protein